MKNIKINLELLKIIYFNKYKFHILVVMLCLSSTILYRMVFNFFSVLMISLLFVEIYIYRF